MNNECKTLSVEQAGRILGIGRCTSYRLARNGTIPTIKLGRKLRVPMPALEKMLQSARANSESKEVSL